jgi:hypothetical protein
VVSSWQRASTTASTGWSSSVSNLPIWTLDQLGLSKRRSDLRDRFVGKDQPSLRYSPHIAAETHSSEPVEGLAVEAGPGQVVVETYLLNQVSFQTTLATKAARCVTAAAGRIDLVDFGFRRTQGTLRLAWPPLGCRPWWASRRPATWRQLGATGWSRLGRLPTPM